MDTVFRPLTPPPVPAWRCRRRAAGRARAASCDGFPGAPSHAPRLRLSSPTWLGVHWAAQAVLPGKCPEALPPAPCRHAMIRAESSVLIERPVEAVFQFVAVDFFANYRKWSPEVVALEQTSAGALRQGSTGRQVRCDAGHRSESRFRVTTYESMRAIAFASISGPRYRVDYRFQAVASATRVTFRFELQPELFLRPFERLLDGAVRRGSDRVVRNLKRLLEARVTSAACETGGPG
jgi:hypothetical protein